MDGQPGASTPAACGLRCSSPASVRPANAAASTRSIGGSQCSTASSSGAGHARTVRGPVRRWRSGARPPRRRRSGRPHPSATARRTGRDCEFPCATKISQLLATRTGQARLGGQLPDRQCRQEHRVLAGWHHPAGAGGEDGGRKLVGDAHLAFGAGRGHRVDQPLGGGVLGPEVAGRTADRQHQQPRPKHLGTGHHIVDRRDDPSKKRASRAGSAVATCNCGQRAWASRRRRPRAPGGARRAEQAITRLARVTATGAGCASPAAVAAATAGQSMHQMASTRPLISAGPPHRASSRPDRQPYPVDAPAARHQGAPGNAGHLIAVHPGVEPDRGPPCHSPRATSRVQPFCRAGHHRARPGGRHRTTGQAEHHQIHPSISTAATSTGSVPGSGSPPAG